MSKYNLEKMGFEPIVIKNTDTFKIPALNYISISPINIYSKILKIV
jgi:hypothetical protein